MHVHFIGICGSGTSVAALIAKKMGYQVSGCDIDLSSYYGHCLMENNIPIWYGHEPRHIDNADLVAFSDAVTIDNAEIIEAKKRNILISWQEFMGKYLQKEKVVVSVAGTHGKTTTTILIGEIMNTGENVSTTAAGTVYTKWNGPCLVSDSKYFICEADEYRRHFLNYHSSYIVINNIEYEHVDYFNNLDDVIDAYMEFVINMHRGGTLVVNMDSVGVQLLLMRSRTFLERMNLKVIAYHDSETNNSFAYPFHKVYEYKLLQFPGQQSKMFIRFGNQSLNLDLNIPGKHNAENAMSALCLTTELGVSINVIQSSFKNFCGVGQRFELIKDVRGIKIYDDYGHHPSELLAVLNMCRIQMPLNRICAVFEPPLLSRTQYFFKEYVSVLSQFDETILLRTYKGREKNYPIAEISELQWRDGFKEYGKDLVYFHNRSEVPGYIACHYNPRNVYVMFSGHLRKVAFSTADRLEQVK